MKNTKVFTSSLVLLVLAISPAIASVEEEIIWQSEQILPVEPVPEDQEGTWVPVPIPISNPTVGTGLQATLLFLHPQKAEDRTLPNTTSGLLGLYTDSESWMVGLFHDGSFRRDFIRFRFIGGTGDFNLDYFGSGEDSELEDDPIEYSLRSDILGWQFLLEVPETENWHMGLHYMYLNTDVTFDETIFPDLPPVSKNMTTSSFGLVVSYDDRDNSYYPTSGSRFNVVLTEDGQATGSDFDFLRLSTFFSHFLSLGDKNVIALRAMLKDTEGDTPFYLLSNLSMRGFALGKYKDNSSLSGHIEWRHKFSRRWGAVLFGEVGSTADEINKLIHSETISAYGGGVRWKVVEDKELHLSLDAGFSGGDSAVYIRVGEQF